MSVTQLIDPRTELGMDQLCINTIRTLSIDALQTGQIRTCGYPDGAGTFGLHGLEPCDAVRSARSNLAQSRSIRALERLRLDAALVRPPLDEDASGEREYERLGQPSVTLDDIRRFRQLDSKAPGHPEYHWVSGVETTTGPLGQGVATTVGMAIAQKWLANRYNRPGFQIFDYTIYTVCGDGCLMEGVSSEAASLAAHLGLDNLCRIYDNNHITIEGNTRITFTEDVAARFLAYGWNVLRVGDANDLDRIEHALGVFRKTQGRPTLIVLDSHIGYGSPNKQDTAAAHSEPLGEEEIRLVKRSYGWSEESRFLIPDGVYEHFAAGVGARGGKARSEWTELFSSYRDKYPKLATEIDLMQRRELPAGWDQNLPTFPADAKGVAGREAPGKVLNVLAKNIPC